MFERVELIEFNSDDNHLVIVNVDPNDSTMEVTIENQWCNEKEINAIIKVLQRAKRILKEGVTK